MNVTSYTGKLGPSGGNSRAVKYRRPHNDACREDKRSGTLGSLRERGQGSCLVSTIISLSRCRKLSKLALAADTLGSLGLYPSFNLLK
jgi:hypothetical protein